MPRDTKYWRNIMKSSDDSDIPDSEEVETSSKVENDETQIIEELVYPFQLTELMVQQYEDPAFNRDHLGDAYPEILVKLLRSLKFWRLTPPKWLIARLQSFKIL